MIILLIQYLLLWFQNNANQQRNAIEQISDAINSLDNQTQVNAKYCKSNKWNCIWNINISKKKKLQLAQKFKQK